MTMLEKVIGIIVAAIALIKALAAENLDLKNQLTDAKKELADFKDKVAADEALLVQHGTELETAVGGVAPVGSTGGISG